MASSSTLLSQINADFLTCQICMDTFKKPKVLTCQHSFCLACLESCETTDSGSYMACPICRQRTLLGMKGVGGLKDNFVFSNMIEMMESWKRSKSPSHKSTESLQEGEIMCRTCPPSGPTMATFQCLDCSDHLCADCAAFHSRTKLTKEHEVVPLEEIENGMHEEKIRQLEMSRCSQHEVQMKHYCNDCEVPVCRDCIVEKHQSHDLSSLEDAEIEKKEKIVSMKSELEESISKLEEVFAEINKLKEKEEAKLSENQNEIDTRAEKFIEAIKRRRAYLLEEIDRVRKGNIAKINGCRDGLETQLKCMENCVQFSNHLLQNETPFEVIKMHRQITETVQELQNKRAEVVTRNDEVMGSCEEIELVFGDMGRVTDILGLIKEDDSAYEEEKSIPILINNKPKAQPRPTPRPRSMYEANKKQNLTPKRPESPLAAKLQSARELFLTPPHTMPRPPKPLSRPASDLSRSSESLKSISPIRAAPEPPKSTKSQKNEVSKKGKAPLPPKPQVPLPPPKSKKPVFQRTPIYPIKASRLVKFGRKGKILTNGEFAGPPKCAIFSKTKKKILVLDGESRHILIFSVEGFFKKSFRVAIPDQVQAKPISIAELGTTHVLVLYKNFITKWGWEGELEHLWGSSDLADANCITTDEEGRILVSDQEKHMIFVYDSQTRQKLMQIGGFGDRDHLFKSPRYICTNQYDDIIVSDHHNHCVKVFDEDGRFLYKFGERGIEDGQLKYPESVTTVPLNDGSDGILVADEGNCRVSLFTHEGKFLSQVLTKEEDKGLKAPQFISVSNTGEELAVRQTNLLQVRVYRLNKLEA